MIDTGEITGEEELGVYEYSPRKEVNFLPPYEFCGKDIVKFLELCKDEMYEITKVPAERLNK